MNATASPVDFAAVARLALSQSLDLLTRWFPAGKKVQREYVIGNLAGDAGDSLSINTQTGRWADFAANAAGGDLVSLYAAIHRLSQSEAARRLAAELGQPMEARTSRAVPPRTLQPVLAAAAEEWTPVLPIPEDAPAPPPSHPAHGRPTHVATYRNRDGLPLGLIYRCEPKGKRKQVMPLTWCVHTDGHHAWQWKSLPKPRSLYGAELLDAAPAATVLVVEGEGKCEAGRRLLGSRMTVVAWPGGANATGTADWSLLRDRKVIVWPDADKPGADAATAIVRAVKAFGANARIAAPPVYVADGWDLADAEHEGWTAEQVMDHLGLTSTPRVTPLVRRSANLDAIRVVNGEADLAASAGEDALLASKMPVFRRDKLLVQPVSQKVPASGGRMTIAAGLDTIGLFGLIDLLCQAVEWVKYDKRDEKWKPINPPADVTSIILSRAAKSRLPSIAGVITTPTLRPDGSLLLEAGYDEATRLYHIQDTALRLPTLPERPTKANALEALADLDALLIGFPFSDDPRYDKAGVALPVQHISKAVALSGIITAVVRGALSVAPMHAFKASTAGSGKSYLVDLASLISTGRPCPVTSAAPDDQAETEKRLVGLLLAGYPIISLDNVNGEIGGDLLCQAIERPLVRVRGLGHSTITEIESRASLFATGNALRVRGDMTRRTLIGSLDAGMERPETREFATDPAAEVLGDRGCYVAACLTIVRAYLAAGKPSQLTPLASFEEWSDWVRGALVWLGCADPALSMEGAREDDPELSDLKELVSAWRDSLALNDGYTLREVDTISNEKSWSEDGTRHTDELKHPDLRVVLMKIAGERGVMNTKRLARYFMDREGRIANGLRIKRKGTGQGGILNWSVEDVSKR